MSHPVRLCFEDRTRRRTFAMYRVIIAVLLYSLAASAAPQDSNVTFVKIQPYTETTDNNTDARVEEIPPTVAATNGTAGDEPASDRYDVTTEPEDPTTEAAEEATTVTTTQATTTTTRAPKPKQSPRFLSKLSHYKSSNLNAVPTNAINSFAISPKADKPFKRKFKSRCRCEKIENCPKLQITVPRCPNDYFLCCF